MSVRIPEILIIDDEVVVTKYIASTLEKSFNVKTTESHNPKEAFEHLKINVPDLIILDMQMPLMDGFTALKHIRNMPNLSNVPVIICTALNTREVLAGLVKLNIEDYIVKPFTSKTVTEKIKKVLGKYIPANILNKNGY